MVIRLAGSKFTLKFITLIILFGAAGIMTDQIVFLVENHHMDFIPAEIGLEADIAIQMAAFGVFLEHRGWLLDRIYLDGIPETVKQFDRYCHDVGVLLILIAVIIESVDLFFLALNNWGIEFAGLKYTEIALLVAINLTAVVTVALFGLRSLRE